MLIFHFHAGHHILLTYIFDLHNIVHHAIIYSRHCVRFSGLLYSNKQKQRKYSMLFFCSQVTNNMKFQIKESK